jgi:O-antigen/teichoic acid export membrane protein
MNPVYIGFVSQLLQYGFGLMILPLALSRLQPAVVGLWYIFLTAQSLIGLLDFGFTQTFARNFAYVFSGARSLLREGIAEPVAARREMDVELFAALLDASRRVYRTIALISLVALLGLGSWYVHRVTATAGLPVRMAWTSWSIFAVAMTVNVYYQWQSALLIGADQVQQNYKIQIASRAVQLIVSVAGLMVAPTLLVLVAGYVVSVIVTRWYGFISVRELVSGASGREDAGRAKALFPVLWHNTGRLGLVSLGAFLITRFSMFAVGFFLGLGVAASYAIAMQALSVVQGLSQVAFSINMPRISGARVEADLARLRHLVLRSLVFAWVLFAAGAVGLITLGPVILDLIHSHTALPATSVVAVMCVVWFLEANHTNCASVIITGNRVPFVPAALISGVAIGVGILLAGRMGGGLMAFVLVQGAVQLAYNNWKWPLLVFRELGVHPRGLLRFGNGFAQG